MLKQTVSGEEIIDVGDRFIPKPILDDAIVALTDRLNSHHKSDPLSKGISIEDLKGTVTKVAPEVSTAALDALVENGTIRVLHGIASMSGHTGSLTESEEAVKEKIEGIYRRAGLGASKLNDVLTESIIGSDVAFDQARKILDTVKRNGTIVQINEELFCDSKSLEELKLQLRSFADESEDRLISVPKFKEIAGISRKNAIPILEYLDGAGITRRAGDQR